MGAIRLDGVGTIMSEPTADEQQGQEGQEQTKDQALRTKRNGTSARATRRGGGAPRKQDGAGSGDGSPPQSKEEGIFSGYGAPPDWPLDSYAALMGVYSSAFLAFLYAVKKTGKKLPDRISLADLALMGVATHRLSRLVTKDWVTSPLRAPFTRYQGPGQGPGETREKARGQGIRQAIGELLTCPWCSGQWMATFFMYGLVLSPRVTRLFASIMAADDIANFLQIAYTVAEKEM